MKTAVLVFSVSFCLAPAVARAQGGAVRDPAPIRTTPFPDVPENHWAFDAVEQLRKLGVVRGYPPEQTFSAPRKARGSRPTPKKKHSVGRGRTA
jgi:hypothetical protein